MASAEPYASLHLAPERQPRQHPTTQFLQNGCPSCHPTNSVKALKAESLDWYWQTKTVQENTGKQTQYKSEKVNNLKYSKTKQNKSTRSARWQDSVLGDRGSVAVAYFWQTLLRHFWMITDNWFYSAHLQPWRAELLNKLCSNTMIQTIKNDDALLFVCLFICLSSSSSSSFITPWGSIQKYRK